VVFTDDVEMYVPPRKGRSHVLRVIRDLLYFEPRGKGTNLARACEYLNRVTRKRAVVFLLSDFLDAGFEKPLRVAAKMHDLISIFLSDPAEAELPGVGLVELEDAETGRRLLVDTSDRKAMSAFHRAALDRARGKHEELKAMGIDVIDVETGVPYDRPLLRFFQMRSRRLRR
jgi:uncharacterized protein (DUF58 family)